MSEKLCANTHKLRPTALSLSLFGATLVAIVALGNTSCENQDIGRPCEVVPGAPAVTSADQASYDQQAIYSTDALECPSRICIKPAVDQNQTDQTPPTTALCSAGCSQDSDCSGGQIRGGGAEDQRCKSGFACTIPFVTGTICCQKLCVCRDFLPPNGATTPTACQNGGAATCQD